MNECMNVCASVLSLVTLKNIGFIENINDCIKY